MKFLVVDDSPTMRRIVKNTLKGLGYNEVIEAEDGKDALAKLYADPVDFIITDWNMPNMNGLEFVKSVKEDDSLAGLPILMVTTRGNKNDILEAMQAKVSSYVIKPFTPPVIKEKIDSILANM
jgi:two-component system, chemotaxis family, chemotaxis protein CheY